MEHCCSLLSFGKATLCICSTNPFLPPISSSTGIPKHPEGSSVCSWKGERLLQGGFLWLLYVGKHESKETRQPDAISACQEARNRYNICFEVSALAETRTRGDVVTSHFAAVSV